MENNIKQFQQYEMNTSSPFLTAVVLTAATSDPQSGSVTQYAYKWMDKYTIEKWMHIWIHESHIID